MATGISSICCGNMALKSKARRLSLTPLGGRQRSSAVARVQVAISPPLTLSRILAPTIAWGRA